MRWLQTTMGEVCLPTVQIDPTRKDTESFRYIDIAGIDREQKTIFRADPIPCESAPSRARKLVQAGDVLVSTVRPNLNAVALVPEELDGEIASTGFSVLRANPKLVNPRYLFYRVQHQEFVACLVANATGASYPAVTDGVVRRAPLPLPSLKEQARIVEILDEADQLRRLRREADAKAARILPALFLKMFGDPATNPRGWDMTTVGDIVRATDYGTSTRASDDGSGIPLIRMGNVDYNGHLDLRDLKHVQLSDSEVARFRLQQGDILFNRTNSKELVGKTGLWDADIDAVAASYFIRVRLDQKQVTPTFFWAFMNCSYIKKILLATARGAIGQANINSSELRAMVIYKPPLDQQYLFTNRWKQIRATIPQRIGDQTDLDNLFSALLQRAFSGQLTAKWREAHSKELLAEMEQQARLLNLPLTKKLELAP